MCFKYLKIPGFTLFRNAFFGKVAPNHLTPAFEVWIGQEAVSPATALLFTFTIISL